MKNLRAQMIESICEEYAGVYHPENLAHISLRAKLHKLSEVSLELDKAVEKMAEALGKALELERCHGGTSCPYPTRKMCNTESHKIMRGALAEFERVGGK